MLPCWRRLFMKKKIDIYVDKCFEKQHGGLRTFALNINNMFQSNGVESKIINDINFSNGQVILMMAIGTLMKSKKEELNEKLSKIRKPLYVVVNDLRELTVYKTNYSGYFENTKIAGVVSITKKSDVVEFIKNNFNSEKIICVNHPFEFSNNFDFEKRENSITSGARFASSKKIIYTSNIFSHLPKRYDLRMYGEEKGIYWYRCLKEDENFKSLVKKKIALLKGYAAPSEIYSDSQFFIDLTIFCHKKIFDGQRSQYTFLEGVDCLALPIQFDVWRYSEINGIWLKTPKDKGEFLNNLEEYLTEIKEYKYDLEKAISNKKKLIKIHSYENCFPEFKEILL